MSKWAHIKHFTPAEFACRCGGCESTGDEMNAHFLEALESLRRMCAFPFIVTSGYRCPDYNEKISTTGRNGPHTTGRAVDIHVMGSKAFILLKFATTKHFTGIGINQRGPHNKRFIHLDDLRGPEFPRSTVWTY